MFCFVEQYHIFCCQIYGNMGTSFESGGQNVYAKHNDIFKEKLRVIAYSLNKFSPQNQATDHHELEILVQSRSRFFVMRLSYSNKGLTVHPLSGPRDKPYKSKKVRRIEQKYRGAAWSLVTRVAKKYQKLKFSLINGIHCQAFCQQIDKELSSVGNLSSSSIWKIYNELE